MWYMLLLLTFAIALLLMIFSRDSYINSELRAYQRTIDEPWLDRVVALRYAVFSNPKLLPIVPAGPILAPKETTTTAAVTTAQ
jgi:hypothetical protein